jgi:ketosteroid isomerase-like protein
MNRILILTAMLLAAHTAHAECSSASARAASEVRQFAAEGQKDWNAGRLDELMARYADDAVILMAGAPSAVGKSAIRELSRGGMKSGVRTTQLEITAVFDCGAVRYAYGVYASQAPGQKESRGSVLVVLKRVRGQWKIAAESWT